MRQRSIPLSDASGPGEARRAATALAVAAGLGDDGRARLALLVTEAATNIVKHARGGEVLLRGVERGGVAGVEALAIDRGPGIRDLDRAFGDGYSTAGSPGTGLGALRRLARELDIFTSGAGTVLVVREWAAAPPPPGRLPAGVVCLPHPAETESGDAWVVADLPDRGLALVVDGLGHGPLAAAAARHMVRVFQDRLGEPPDEILRLGHAALATTRGAAAAVAEVEHASGRVRYCGVGNIAGRIVHQGAARSLVSQSGTLGGRAARFHVFEYAWPAGGLLILASDGLSTPWDLAAYPGLAQRDPALVAAVLYRDFRRGYDDVTVLVARRQGT